MDEWDEEEYDDEDDEVDDEDEDEDDEDEDDEDEDGDEEEKDDDDEKEDEDESSVDELEEENQKLLEEQMQLLDEGGDILHDENLSEEEKQQKMEEQKKKMEENTKKIEENEKKIKTKKQGDVGPKQFIPNAKQAGCGPIMNNPLPCPVCKKISLFFEPFLKMVVKTAAMYCIGVNRTPRWYCMNPKCKSYYLKTGDSFVHDGVKFNKKKNLFYVIR